MIASLLTTLLVLGPAQESGAAPRFTVHVLGIAQDGGMPQLGCDLDCCRAARNDPKRALRRTALGIADGSEKKLVLVEATADIEAQVAQLHSAAQVSGRGRNPIDAVLVTHAHVGHYLGLLWLGRETAASEARPLFCSRRFADFLAGSPPFAMLTSEHHVAPSVIEPDTAFEPIPGLVTRALPVPHRDEFSDTLAFVFRGPKRSLLFLPDIDKWEKWERRIEDVVAGVDYALLDGTFFDAGELPGRSIEKIPHPLVPESMARLGKVASKVFFIHLNHTNRLLRDPAARAEIEKQGFHVAAEGDRFEL